MTKNRTSRSGTRSRQLVQRVAQRQAEVLLVEGLLELGADRLLQFVADHAHRRLERVAGAERARQQIERFGELLLELLHPPGAAAASGSRTAQRAEHRRRNRQEPERVRTR